MHSSASRLQTVVISRRRYSTKESRGESKVAGAFSSDIAVTRKGHIYIPGVFRMHTVIQGKEL